MPRPYPREFRDDVVRVARIREDGVTIELVARLRPLLVGVVGVTQRAARATSASFTVT